MTINRVPVVWSGTGVTGGGLSLFYFDSAVGTAQQQVDAVGAFLTATNDQRAIGLNYVVGPDVSSLTLAGVLFGVTTVGTPASGVGTATGEAMPYQTQGLMRLLTSTVVNGRLLRGRLFLPGCVEAANNNGIPTTTYTTDYNTAGATLISDANTTWVVWSRQHATSSAVVTAPVWTKFASLRSRRD